MDGRPGDQSRNLTPLPERGRLESFATWRQRQRKGEGRSLTLRRAEFQCSPHQGHVLVGDGQPQSGSTCPDAGLPLLEGLEDGCLALG